MYNSVIYVLVIAKMNFNIFLVAQLLVCCISGFSDTRPSRILAFLPTETRSHFNGFKPLLETLVARGHYLTLVSPYSLSSTMDNGSPLSYKHVQVEIATINGTGINHLDKNSVTNRLPSYVFVIWLGPFITRKALEKQTVKDFIMNDTSSFDLVIVENFFHECFVTLGHKYSAPVVQLLPFAANPRVSQWHGNPYNPSYIADFTSGYAAPMTFWQRTENTVSAIFNTLINRMVYMRWQRDIMDEHFRYDGYEGRPDLETMLRNVSLTLINSHPLVGPVVPLVPSYIQVAGMHVKPAKTLPQDLKLILDSAKNGVIYFSLGSVIKSSKMPPSTVMLLLSELSKVKQTVLWKWEDDNLPILPANVIVRKWFPQNDILSHPNCQLFITHGGIHSVVESVYHGVPMLAIPVFGDQLHNSVEVEQRGFAMYLSYFELTAEAFGIRLQMLLNKPQFREAAVKVSFIMRDNPTSIMDKAVFWIEYVIRHEGARHLRTTANDLYWFQYYLLDVATVMSLIIAFVIYFNYKCCSYASKKILCKSTESTRSTLVSSKSKKKNQ